MSNKTQHTLGPWEADGGFVIADLFERHGKEPIVGPMYAGQDLPLVEQEANAQLIAAAPDLLEACKALTEAIDPDSGYASHRSAVKASRKAEKAIAKARGDK